MKFFLKRLFTFLFAVLTAIILGMIAFAIMLPILWKEAGKKLKEQEQLKKNKGKVNIPDWGVYRDNGGNC